MSETADVLETGQAILIDQAILLDEISDDALEAAATMGGAIPTASIDILPPNCC